MQAEEIFLAALEKLTPAERRTFLDEACRDDPTLRAHVEGLLQSHQEAGSFLDAPLFDGAPTIDQPLAEKPGTRIGPYKLLQQVGEGGFGVVFMAEQLEPVRRKVALKVIKPGMDTRQVIARFEAERQALAMMDHPHIARVMDAGATASGRPYFVMELVRGVPITAYCDQNNLSVRERLALFAAVCGAIQHAHQKGIIHRDIKPSNVLVTSQDGAAAVKVIDFGVAKAMGQQLTDKTLFTDFTQMIGTPLYMSPEQAELSGADIDTRSDIYSLGVLLYELLTGSTPVDKEQMKKAAFDEIRRLIREEEPPKPSTRISSAEAAPSIAAQRHTEPAKLARLVRGDLDWIVMKALEKDRDRRYETASGFSADIEHHLRDEPVRACPPSSLYRFGKFARRNKGAMTMTVVIGVALLLALGSLGWISRDRELRRARIAGEVHQFLNRAESLYAAEKLAEARGEVQKARGVLDSGTGNEDLQQRVRQWLTDLDTAAKFEDLRRQHPDISDWDRVYAGYAQVFREYGIDIDALPPEDAAARIADSRIMFELTVALDTWAWRLQISPERERGGWQRLRTIQRAADPDAWRERLHQAADTRDLQALYTLAAEADVKNLHIRTLALLGDKLTTCGDPEAGVKFLARAQCQHPDSYLLNDVLARCMTYLKPTPWDRVIEFRRVALALNSHSPAARAALADALRQQGRSEEALEAYRDALRLQPEPLTFVQLGLTLAGQRKLDDAIAAYKSATDLDPKCAVAYRHQGQALLELNKLNEALAAAREVVRLVPADGYGHALLGRVLLRAADPPGAEAAFREAIRLVPGNHHMHFGLGRALDGQQQFAAAEVAFRAAIQLNPDDAPPHEALGWGLIKQQKYAEAEAEFRLLMRLKPDAAGPRFGLGTALYEQHQFTGAEAALREAIGLDPAHRNASQLLARTLAAQSKPKEETTAISAKNNSAEKVAEKSHEP